jgi:hypothetical protein
VRRRLDAHLMTALTLVDAVLKFFVSRVNHGMFPRRLPPKEPQTECHLAL